MSEQEQATATVDVPMEPPATAPQVAPRPQPQAISDPRQIAAVIMARMNLINTKKDELTIAIKGVTDLTQQLVQSYAGQMQVIEQLAARLKAMEETNGAKGVNGLAVAPSMPSAERQGGVRMGLLIAAPGGPCLCPMRTRQPTPNLREGHRSGPGNAAAAALSHPASHA